MKTQDSGFRIQDALAWVGGYCALPIACVVIALLLLSGCSPVQRVPPVQVWDDMKVQEKFKPQMENEIFADHRDSRVPPRTPSRAVTCGKTLRITPAWMAISMSARV